MLSTEEFWSEIAKHANTLRSDLEDAKKGTSPGSLMVVLVNHETVSRLHQPELVFTHGNCEMVTVLLDALGIMIDLEHKPEAAYLYHLLFSDIAGQSCGAVALEQIHRWFKQRFGVKKVPSFRWTNWSHQSNSEFSGVVYKMPVLLYEVMQTLEAGNDWLQLE